jgi:hypothetical protein
MIPRLLGGFEIWLVMIPDNVTTKGRICHIGEHYRTFELQLHVMIAAAHFFQLGEWMEVDAIYGQAKRVEEK